MRRAVVVLCVFAGMLGSAAQGQTQPKKPVGELRPYVLDSGPVTNPRAVAAAAYEAVVQVPQAAWLRLYFADVTLAPDAFLRVISATDGEVQELGAAALREWGNTTAYFNGDTVFVEVVAPPTREPSRFVLAQVALEEAGGDRGPCAADDCGICDADDRVPSNATWSGRLMPVGCTASIYNQDSCVVTAGHCAGGGTQVLQFNVPPSSANCGTNQPPVADQFPITGKLYLNDGPGADWAAMTSGSNTLGETAYQRYGEFRPLAGTPAPDDSLVQVWGYGVDNNDPTRSQVQQFSQGFISSVGQTTYHAALDITYGNSGSSLIYNNYIIGIVTHCPCPATISRIDLPAFVAARDALCGPACGNGTCDDGEDCSNCPGDCGPCGYCAASGTGTGPTITSVTLAGVTHTSGASNYSDFTAIELPLARGVSYSMSVTVAGASAATHGALWVDWNQDTDFGDNGERIPVAWTGAGPTFTGTLVVPATAAIGMTRLRFRFANEAFDPYSDWCGTTSAGEVEDYNGVITIPDTTVPQPDPMAFEVPPTAISTTAITMTGVEAVDADSPPIQYRFDFTSGGAGGADRTWDASRTYTNAGLTPNTFYGYRVQARDSAPAPNRTIWSPVVLGCTWIETPPGVTVGTITDATVTLTAAGTFSNLTAESSGLFFDSLIDGGDGGLNVWTQAVAATATGLMPNTAYAFQVKARNRQGVETPYGPPANATTLARVPGAPSLTPTTSTDLSVTLDLNGNPAATELAIYCATSDDTTWAEHFAGANGHPSATAVWQTAAAWQAVGLHSLQPGDGYTLAVTARNSDGIETAAGPGQSITLPTGPVLCAGDMNCDGTVNFGDIDKFVSALSGPTAWAADPTNAGCPWLNGDTNVDSAVTFADIDPFVARLGQTCR